MQRLIRIKSGPDIPAMLPTEIYLHRKEFIIFSLSCY